MSYDLDTVYVVSLGLLVGLVVMPVRQWADATAAKRGVKVNSFIWGWAAMGLSMVLVVPLLITKGAALGWKLLAAAYTEGLPVGAVAIVAYDLGMKPLRKYGGFLLNAVKNWIVSSTDKGGTYGAYDYGLGEEELEAAPGSDFAPGADGTGSGAQAGTPADSP